MKRRSGLNIMLGLISLLKPMMGMMLLCITLGTLGFLAAIWISVLAVHLLLNILALSPWTLSFIGAAVIMIVLAVARGGLRYGEQTCGHYIAFKLLAIIRDKVFGALRRLCPAKLEGRGRGDLIALITADIELLEVFYAHTIAPVCIAIAVSLIMTVIIGFFHWGLALVALFSYLLVGTAVPLLTAHRGSAYGMASRSGLAELNNVFLESIRGLRELKQYGRAGQRVDEIRLKTEALNHLQAGIRAHEALASAWSGALVMLLPLVMIILGFALGVSWELVLMSTVMLSASFGPVLALANLSAAMDSTLAAGERVLALLEEEPDISDITEGKAPEYTGAKVSHLDFAYDKELILHDLSAIFPAKQIVAVTGRSGSGKSTLLKLLMRFWQAPTGSVQISDSDVGEITTDYLRSIEAYMRQDTDLFNLSIGDNIRIGRPEATAQEVIAAAAKASLHDFIMTLPQGYDTPIGELGERLSGGERQRIGLARAFLYNAPLLLLDEPTSNLDSLNEGIILQALDKSAREEGRTVVLVSHRQSTLSIADRSYAIENGRLS